MALTAGLVDRVERVGEPNRPGADALHQRQGFAKDII